MGTRQEGRHDHGNWEDTGCEVSVRCQICPLARCRYDDPVAYRRWKRGTADYLAQDVIASRAPAAEAAAVLGVAVRTIYRKRAEMREAT